MAKRSAAGAQEQFCWRCLLQHRQTGEKGTPQTPFFAVRHVECWHSLLHENCCHAADKYYHHASIPETHHASFYHTQICSSKVILQFSGSTLHYMHLLAAIARHASSLQQAFTADWFAYKPLGLQLKDGHWVLSFPSPEAASYATLVVDQAAAKLRAYLIEVNACHPSTSIRLCTLSKRALREIPTPPFFLHTAQTGRKGPTWPQPCCLCMEGMCTFHPGFRYSRNVLCRFHHLQGGYKVSRTQQKFSLFLKMTQKYFYFYSEKDTKINRKMYLSKQKARTGCPQVMAPLLVHQPQGQAQQSHVTQGGMAFQGLRRDYD